MNETIINGELTLSIPEGFSNYSKEELKIQNPANTELWAVRDVGRHMIIIVQWMKYNVLALKLADPKTMIRRNEQQTGKLLENAQYKQLGFFSVNVAGREAQGYRYSYHVEGAEQEVQTVLLKSRQYVYNMSFYYRPENRDEDQGLIDSILETVRL